MFLRSLFPFNGKKYDNRYDYEHAEVLEAANVTAQFTFWWFFYKILRKIERSNVSLKNLFMNMSVKH